MEISLNPSQNVILEVVILFLADDIGEDDIVGFAGIPHLNELPELPVDGGQLVHSDFHFAFSFRWGFFLCSPLDD